jgi:hypothetical protein
MMRKSKQPRQTPHTYQTYHAYLLRLWCEGDGQRWRASLQSAKTEEIQHFPHAAALLAFLSQQMGVALPDAPAQSPTLPDDPKE